MQIVPFLIGIALGLVILLISSSIVVIETGTIGVVKRIGKLQDRILEPGLNFVMPIIDKVERISTLVRQNEFPAEPELIDRTEGNVLPGKKEPFRILHAGAHTAIFYVQENSHDPISDWDKVGFETYLERTSKDKHGQPDQDKKNARRKAIENDPLEQPITTEVSFVVEWQINEDERNVLRFITNVGSEHMAFKRMEDTVARALQEFLGPTTAGHAKENMAHVSSVIEERIRLLVGQNDDPELVAESGLNVALTLPREPGTNRRPSWGVKVTSGYIKSINPGLTVNKARAAAAKAVADKVQAIENAEGVAESTRLQADANAHQTRVQAEADSKADRLRGVGEAARIRAVAKVTQSDQAKFIMQNEAAREVLAGARTIIVPSDMGAIAGILALGEKMKEKPPESV